MNKHICKAKHLLTGEWVYGYYVQATHWLTDEISHVIFKENEIELYPRNEFTGWSEVDPETICRYIGLNDKRGNPIFENDMLHWYNDYTEKWTEPCIVQYGDFNCSCCDGVYGWYFKDGDIRDIHLYEICGNIFDNTELMED